MIGFQLSRDQVARVAIGVTADEMGRAFGRHVDFITLAAWGASTALGATGLRLTQDQRKACAERVASAFDVPGDTLAVDDAVRFGDWADAVCRGLADRMETLRFTTTGREGETRTIEHRADAVFQDARAAANLFHGRRRIVSLVAPHNLVAFAVTILAPNLQGLPTYDARSLPPEELESALAFGDLLVATPTLWRYLASHIPRLPDNVMGVSFAEKLTPQLAADLRAIGLGAMREIYGAAEMGLIGWRDGPTGAFTLFDHWERDADHILIRITPPGERLPTPVVDSFDWAGPRSFTLAGRKDGAIQVGAVNIYPERVAEALRAHPSVEDAFVRAPDLDDGAPRLTAHILLKDRRAPDEAAARAIDAWCAKRLGPQERPRIYRYEPDAASMNAARVAV
ncbi:MAG: hypothetical protein AAFR11_15770 [Pseudomonadota bacterium]